MRISEEEYLAHYGVARRSGRYPWGSTNNEPQNSESFITYVDGLRKDGLTEKEVAQAVGMTTGELRKQRAIAKNEIKQAQTTRVEQLKRSGMSNNAISRETGLPESTIRNLLKKENQDKANILDSTVEMLKQNVDKKGYVDVGKGVEYQLNISKSKKDQAVAKMKELGYNHYYIRETQLGTGKETTIRVLAKPEYSYSDVSKDKANIQQIQSRSVDGGRTWDEIHPPLEVSLKRVGIKYGSEGGALADGVIYIRRGLDDLSLGGSNYAQVRIAVDSGHYIKGMAMYKDDLPPGVDILFNTNKEDTGDKTDALKPMNKLDNGKIDYENPFGSSIKRQILDRHADGTVTVKSAMNIVNEEGDWNEWSKNLSSQMLSKQSLSLAQNQLAKTYEQRVREFELLNSLTNEKVKKKLLETFGDECDAAAVHLKAAALGARQRTQVILPINELKPEEVYAPNFNHGERVVLIRYPHAGTFEIPELIVNNNNRAARKLMGNAKDAIGINAKVAERLSGADFDGDTVLVIPNNQRRIKHTPALKGLENFDPRSEYKGYEGMPEMSTKMLGIQMGEVSNLITDMTIKNAPPSEIARAVRHSMVVIDAKKHNLNYRLSARNNGIAALKAKYQGSARGGASTLISQAKRELRVPDFRERRASEGGPIDKETGKRIYVETGNTYTDKNGNVVTSIRKVKSLEVIEDAHDLMSKPSGTAIERVYAEHSNRLKALGNKARKESVNIPRIKESSSAKKVYKKELDELKAALALAKTNAPYERQAQLIANANYKLMLKADPDIDEAQKKKLKGRALTKARLRVGAKKEPIRITDEQWEAIQAGAVSDTMLGEILDNADLDRVRELATPRPKRVLTAAKAARAQRMLSGGATRAQVAATLGVSISTLDEYTDAKGGEYLDERR